MAESKNLAEIKPVMIEKLKKDIRDWQESVVNSLIEADYKSSAP